MHQSIRNIISLPTLLLFVLVFQNVYSLNINLEEVFNGEKLLENLKLLAPSSIFENFQKAFIVYKYNETGISDTCGRDIDLLLQSLVRRELWALKMLDASSKIPAGILEGNIIDLGIFDECISSHGQVEEVEIKGHHCMYTVNVTYNDLLIISPVLSICVPRSCSPDDTLSFLNTTIDYVSQLEEPRFLLSNVKCAPVDQKIWNTEFTVYFSIFITLVGFLIMSTMCDIFHEFVHVGQYRHYSLQLFASFSIRKSIKAIFKTEVNYGNLPVIHGIRCLSMAWVILGHRFVANTSSVNINAVQVVSWAKSWKSLYIFTATLAVDAFFALSGLLVAYLFINRRSKNKTFNIPMYYLHRYLRLTPSIFALVAFDIVFKPIIATGPRWNNMLETSRENWWLLVLYIQNFSNLLPLSLGHLWYLAVDMQLFWFSPLILYPLYKKPKIGVNIIAFLILVSLIVHVSIVVVNEYKPCSLTVTHRDSLINESFFDVYIKPYTRAMPWFIGILFGYDLANNNRKLSKPFIYTGWFLAIGSFVFCIFGMRYFLIDDYVYNASIEGFYSAVSKTLWGFVTCWIVYVSNYNRAGPISSFLSWKAFLPLSRISYSVYLIHYTFQQIQISLKRTPDYFGDFDIWQLFFSDLIICFLGGLFFNVIFESPIIVLEKLLFKRKHEFENKPQNELRKKDEEHINDEKF